MLVGYFELVDPDHESASCTKNIIRDRVTLPPVCQTQSITGVWSLKLSVQTQNFPYLHSVSHLDVVSFQLICAAKIRIQRFPQRITIAVRDHETETRGLLLNIAMR